MMIAHYKPDVVDLHQKSKIHLKGRRTGTTHPQPGRLLISLQNRCI